MRKSKNNNQSYRGKSVYRGSILLKLFFGVLMCYTPNFYAQTFSPIADAFTQSGASGGVNHGADTNLLIRFSPPDYSRDTYLKFDISSLGLATSAQVRLYQFAGLVGPAYITVTAVNDDSWTEMGITYNNAPTNLGGSIVKNITNGNPFVKGWITFDVTSLVQAETDGILSLKFSLNDLSFNCFGRSAVSPQKPELVVVGTPKDTEPPSVPDNLTASIVTSNSVTLNWDASTDNVGVKEYEVFLNGNSIGTTTGPSKSVSGLNCGTAYSLTVKAKDNAGNTSVASTAFDVSTSACPDTQAPSIPSGLDSSAITQSSFTLSWMASTDNIGVKEYEVFMNGDSIATTTDTSLFVSGLVCGTNYAMKVKAIDDAANYSEASIVLEIKTSDCPVADTQAPSIPSDLASSAINQSSFTISWMASTDNIGVKEYEVFVNGSSIGTTAVTSKSVSGLNCGNTYAITVKAKDDAGNTSDASTSFDVSTSICTDTQAPSIPSDLASSAINQSSFTISWMASTDNIGVKEYEVFVNGSSIGTTAVTFKPVSGLNCGNTYAITVKAKDDAGNTSDASTSFNVSTSACPDTQAPSIPSGLASSAINQSSFTISWMASTDNIGVKEYEVFVNGSSIGTTAVTSKSVSDLNCGNTYAITVKAKDDAGNTSDASTSFNVSTSACPDTQAPSIPSGLASSAINQSSFTISWMASTDNIGVKEYEVFVNGSSIGTTAVTSKSVSGLNCGNTYAITVKAKDDAGNTSDASTSFNVSTSACPDTQAPSIPSGLASSAINQSSFTISWMASTDNIGVKEYEVFVNGSSIGTTAVTSKSVSGLNCGNTYAITVKAKDDAGNTSDASTSFNVSTSACPDTQAPSIPSGLASSEITQSSFTISWMASTDNIGVKEYEVFVNGSSIGTTAVTSKSVSGLNCGNTYAITVKAKDDAGNTSDASTSFNVSTSACPDTQAPSIPSGLASSEITQTSFTISWMASTDNIGVKEYEVFSNGVSLGTTNTTSMAVSSLTPNSVYIMTVKAIDNANNKSSESAPLNITTINTDVKDAVGGNQNSVNLYPNPTSDLINISFGRIVKENTALTLSDLTGKVVYRDQVSKVSDASIPVSSNPSGIYILTISDGTRIIIKKVIIK